MTIKMTTKRFIATKLSAKVTADGFLAAYSEFLKGEGYCTPILEAYERKELAPNVTFTLCQEAALQHWFQQEKAKADKRMEEQKEQASGTKIIRRKKEDKSESDGEEGHSSKYTVTLMCKVYDKETKTTKIQVGTIERVKEVELTLNGVKVTKTVKEEEPAIFKCDSFNASQRLADRRLADRADSVYATINNNIGKPITTIIQRDDAIARVFKSPKGPATRNTHSGGSNLGFGIKAKNDTCYFSRG
jgi:hypothetical protein